MNASLSSSTDSITSLISDARSELDGDYVPVARCVNLLLDCYNAADGEVREVVTSLLPDFTTGNIRKTDDFVKALDRIETANSI